MKVGLTVDRDFEHRFLRGVSSRRLPLQGTMEITRRCNLRCPYCYVGFDHALSPEEEMTTDQVISLIDQIAAEGCLFLTLTGGEPLLREDFRSLYSHALKRGLLISLFTNATLIDGELAAFWGQHPPFYVDITLLGATPRVYEKVSGVSGSFRKSLEAIRLLEENSVPFRLKSVISTLNQEEMGQMREFAESRGKLFRFDTLITPQLNGSLRPLRYRLTPEEVVRLDREDEGKWEDWIEFACRHGGKVHSDRLYKCGAGLHSFHITSTGKLGLCVGDTNFYYDLLNGSFKEGWHQFIPWVREMRTERVKKCDDCELLPLCGTCPARSKLETGSPEEAVEFCCRVAHLRAKLLAEDVGRRHEEILSKA